MVLSPPQSALHLSIAHVSRPTAGNTHAFTQYVIRVSDERAPGLDWTVYRRYSEFREFRMRLEDAIKQHDMCEGCEIMSKRSCFVQFPHRRLFGNTRDGVLEARRLGLDVFLGAVAKHARTCRESMTCQTRPLMDQFLMINDMRYTYLNVNMSEQEDHEFAGKVSLDGLRHSTGGLSTSNTASHLSATTRHSDAILSTTSSQHLLLTDAPKRETRTSRNSASRSSYSERSSAEESTHLHKPKTKQRACSDDLEGRVFSGRMQSLPNLLDSSRESSARVTRHSFNDAPTATIKNHRPLLDTTATNNTTNSILNYNNNNNNSGAASTSRLSDWETARFQPVTAGRHSDPGFTRNDLLSFASCSSAGRRSDQQRSRNRPRRVHLSSAAKRVKKLEEQEARFTSRQAPRAKLRTVLATIPETCALYG